MRLADSGVNDTLANVGQIRLSVAAGVIQIRLVAVQEASIAKHDSVIKNDLMLRIYELLLSYGVTGGNRILILRVTSEDISHYDTVTPFVFGGARGVEPHTSSVQGKRSP